MNKWSKVSDFVTYSTKGITPKYVEHSKVIVLNQKTIRNNRIDYSFAQYTDDTKITSDSKYLKEGDILINSTGAGTAGRCAFVSEIPKGYNLITDSHVLLLRCKSYFEAKCLNFVLFSFEKKLMSFMTGSSGQSELDKVVLFNIRTKMPTDHLTQKSISSILSNLEQKIELNNKIDAELEAMAKTLYDYWFVQFDFPNANGKPYKSSGGKMVWSEELKREIPNGWEVTELRNYLTSNRGVSYSGKDISGGGIPMINLNSFNINSTYKPEGIKFFSGILSDSKKLNPFDLVMCNTQQTALDPQKDIIGKSFLVPDIFETEVVSSHHVTTIEVKNDKLKYYLNGLFNTDYFHRYISGYATGTNILGLNFEGVLSYRTAIPNNELLAQYKSIILNIEKQKSKAIKENQQLASLRDWLLPLLMNGQVKVKNNETESKITESSVLNIPKSKTVFAKQVLAGKIVSLFREDKNFTDIKFQKLQYLAEHIAEADLDWNYYRKMAGPYDNKFMHTVPTKLKINKWFEGRTQKFKPLAKVDDVDKYYQSYFSPAETKLKKLFDLLKNATEAHSEVIATVYAVWNNLIIKNEKVTDDRIVELFFEWSSRKESYTKKQIVGTIEWIKEKGFEPNGFGYLIKELKGK